jgi:hypothetical protein
LENYIKQLAIQLQDIRIIKENDEFLAPYFLVNQKTDYREVLNDPDNFNKLINEIDKIYNFNKFSVYHNCEMKLVLNNLITSICMLKGEDEKKRVLPLIIYLDADNIFYNFLIKKNFFDDLITCVIGNVEKFSFKINKDSIPNNHWESESYLQYEDGVKNLNFLDIYQFIEAYERSGRTFEFSSVSLFVLVLSALDIKKLCSILDERKDTVTIIYLISNLSVPDKLLLAKESSNLILKIEVLRQLLYCTHNRTSCSILYENEHAIIEKILLDISQEEELWANFLKFYMPFPSRSPLLFKSLSSTLEKLDDQRLDLFLNSIDINWTIDNDISSALNACFFHIKDDNFQKKTFLKVLDLWEVNLLSNQESMHSLKLTNVINICVSTMKEFIEKEDVEKKVNIVLNNVIEIDNHWFETETAQNNFLYVQLTFLFLYGFGVNHFNLIKQKNSIRSTLKNSRTLQLLQNEYSNGKTTLQCFDEYIFND